MKAFDMEAAKRGEKLKNGSDPIGWVDAHFIGCSLDGNPVIQIIGGAIFESLPSHLRMSPKPPREMYVQVYKTNSGIIGCTWPCDDPSDVQLTAKGYLCLGAPQKVIIQEE